MIAEYSVQVPSRVLVYLSSVAFTMSFFSAILMVQKVMC